MIPKPYMDIFGLNRAEVSLDGLLMSLSSPLLFSCCSGKLLKQNVTLLCLPTSGFRHPLPGGHTSNVFQKIYRQWWLVLNSAHFGSNLCSLWLVFIIMLITSVYSVCLWSRFQSRCWELLSPLGALHLASKPPEKSHGWRQWVVLQRCDSVD